MRVDCVLLWSSRLVGGERLENANPDPGSKLRVDMRAQVRVSGCSEVVSVGQCLHRRIGIQARYSEFLGGFL